MNTGQKRSLLSYIPGYSQNAVLQLIIISGCAFALLGMAWAITMILYSGDASFFNRHFFANIALPSIYTIKAHWWTLFTYGWFHFNGFWELISNMLWLYCFGSVVQMLVGYKQVIPLYAYCLLAGGIFYTLAQLLPGDLAKTQPGVWGIVGGRAGLMGLAAAAITLTPGYRFYLTETFRVHILVVGAIFAFLMLLSTGFYIPHILLLCGGGLTGWGYVALLKAGYRPGDWIYSLSSKVESLVTPDERAINLRRNSRRGNVLDKISSSKIISQKRIDEILDKINQKGYNSLSSEEKDILMRAGKE